MKKKYDAPALLIVPLQQDVITMSDATGGWNENWDDGVLPTSEGGD